MTDTAREALFARLRREAGESVAYMIREITHICRDMKPRSPGTAGEREAGEYMGDVLRKDCGCTRVRIESFREQPGAFYGYLYYSAALDLLCCLGWFVSAWLSLLSGAAAVLLMLFQFILYHRVVDPFFPTREGTNVTALRPCTGQIRRRVFFNGHIDAAWESPVNY